MRSAWAKLLHALQRKRPDPRQAKSKHWSGGIGFKNPWTGPRLHVLDLRGTAVTRTPCEYRRRNLFAEDDHMGIFGPQGRMTGTLY